MVVPAARSSGFDFTRQLVVTGVLFPLTKLETSSRPSQDRLDVTVLRRCLDDVQRVFATIRHRSLHALHTKIATFQIQVPREISPTYLNHQRLLAVPLHPQYNSHIVKSNQDGGLNDSFPVRNGGCQITNRMERSMFSVSSGSLPLNALRQCRGGRDVSEEK